MLYLFFPRKLTESTIRVHGDTETAILPPVKPDGLAERFRRGRLASPRQVDMCKVTTFPRKKERNDNKFCALQKKYVPLHL